MINVTAFVRSEIETYSSPLAGDRDLTSIPPFTIRTTLEIYSGYLSKKALISLRLAVGSVGGP